MENSEEDMKNQRPIILTLNKLSSSITIMPPATAPVVVHQAAPPAVPSVVPPAVPQTGVAGRSCDENEQCYQWYHRVKTNCRKYFWEGNIIFKCKLLLYM